MQVDKLTMCSLRIPWSQRSDAKECVKLEIVLKTLLKIFKSHSWLNVYGSVYKKIVTTLSACQSFEGLRLSNPSCKCLFPIARSCIGTERAATEQQGSGSCPVWSLKCEDISELRPNSTDIDVASERWDVCPTRLQSQNRGCHYPVQQYTTNKKC